MLYLLHENTIPALWLIFALYWVVAAVRQRRAEEHESVWTRLSYLVLAAIAFLFLIAIGGTALSEGVWRGLLALAIAVISWAIKARKEESWLRNEFGAQFEEYCQRTGFLLPRLTY